MVYEPYGPGSGPARPGGGRRPARKVHVKQALLLMIGWLALLWLLEIMDTAQGHALDAYGITPRVPGELRDVIPAAFMHFGFEHLAANSVPLLVLGFLAALHGLGRFLGVVSIIIVISGLGVWLVAPEYSNTAGASGVVFGLLGYLLIRGFVDRRLVDVLIGVGVAAAYGSLLWGALPMRVEEGVSWQGHLFGLIGGVVAAFYLRERRGQAPRTR